MNQHRPISLPMRIFSVLIIVSGILFPVAMGAEQPGYAGVENLGLPNWAGEDYAPIITPDGRFLLFQSDRPGAMEKSDFFYTENLNYRDRTGEARWTVPVPLHLPLKGEGSRTMQVVRPTGTITKPAGAFQFNSHGFEGMGSYRFVDGEPVEVYFTSVASADTGRPGFDGLNIYYIQYQDSRWGPVTHLNALNSHFNDRMPTISPDGNTLYFVSDRPGGYGGYDLWYSHRDDETGKWRNPINAGESFNTPYNEISPVFSRRGKSLFYSSDRPGGFGYYDLYVSRTDEFGIWSTGENLGEPFNSTRDDEYLSATDDGNWAYFTSDRRHLYAKGDFDIYRTPLPERLREPSNILFTGTVLDGSTREPLGVEATVHIMYEKQTIVVSADVFRRDPEDKVIDNFAVKLISGRLYRVRFSAPGYHPQEISLDYTDQIPEGLVDRRTVVLQPLVKIPHEQETAGVVIPGRVVDEETGLSLPGSDVEYRISEDDGEVQKAVVDEEGRFQLRVPSMSTFVVFAAAPGYQPVHQTFTERSDLKEVVIRLKKLPEDAICPSLNPQCIDNTRIYFDLDSSSVGEQEHKKLDSVVNILRAHPELKIEIQGHADRSYRGPKNRAYQYNLLLSEQRARTVREELLKKGVSGERLIVRGYSFLKPRVEDGVTSRALNRRVEFRRIRK